MRMPRQIRRLGREFDCRVRGFLYEAFESGDNRYRNRGFLRCAFAAVAALPAVGAYHLSQAFSFHTPEAVAIVAVSGVVALDQLIAAFGNFSGHYRSYGTTHIRSAKELGWFSNRLVALGFNVEPPAID